MARDLAARRAELVSICASQREALREQAGEAIAPLAQARGFDLSKLKIPLAIGGVVLGLIVASPRRAVSIITTGLSAWRMASSVIGAMRESGQPREGGDPV